MPAYPHATRRDRSVALRPGEITILMPGWRSCTPTRARRFAKQPWASTLRSRKSTRACTLRGRPPGTPIGGDREGRGCANDGARDLFQRRQRNLHPDLARWRLAHRRNHRIPLNTTRSGPLTRILTNEFWILLAPSLQRSVVCLRRSSAAAEGCNYGLQGVDRLDRWNRFAARPAGTQNTPEPQGKPGCFVRGAGARTRAPRGRWRRRRLLPRFRRFACSARASLP